MILISNNDKKRNVRVMIRELLTFLEKADKEFKPKITSEICSAAEMYILILILFLILIF
jgi:hypothetical protein